MHRQNHIFLSSPPFYDWANSHDWITDTNAIKSNARSITTPHNIFFSEYPKDYNMYVQYAYEQAIHSAVPVNFLPHHPSNIAHGLLHKIHTTRLPSFLQCALSNHQIIKFKSEASVAIREWEFSLVWLHKVSFICTHKHKKHPHFTYFVWMWLFVISVYTRDLVHNAVHTMDWITICSKPLM